MQKLLLLTLLTVFFQIPLFSQTFTKVDNPDNPINSVNIRGFYRGCAWVDIDNDGDLDLTSLTHAFRNEGNEQFTKIPSFGQATDFLGGISWADYGNDGDLDCLYNTHQKTIIYENDGTGNFIEKTIDENNSLGSWSVSFHDYNNDGIVDIIGAVANGFQGLNTPAFFYQGEENGEFTRIERFEFTQVKKPYTVSYWADYDDDGDSDLFMASGPGGSPGLDHHYKNMLTETGAPDLQRIDNEPFATDQQDGQCYNFIDYDLDGDRDLYLTNYGGASNRFYLNEDGNFVSTSNTLVFNNTSLANAWGDFDLDGDEDVIITADNLGSGGYFVNNGDGSFTKRANIFALNFPSNSNVSGITIGDYDNDGDLDFFAQGGINGSNGPRALFRNDLVSVNNWVNFQLLTAMGSPAALGTKIKVKVDLEGGSKWLQREVTAQNTFMGHNSLRQHFGLGADLSLDSIIVEWSSGLKEIYTDKDANQFYTLTEGEGISTNTEQITNPSLRLTIFPNPVDTEFIQINRWWEDNKAPLQLEVYNLEGKLMLQQSVIIPVGREEKVSIPTPLVSNGTYFIQMKQGKRSAVGKIIISR